MWSPVAFTLTCRALVGVRHQVRTERTLGTGFGDGRAIACDAGLCQP